MICKECGQEFTPRNGMQKICDRQHYRTCVICGQQFPVSRSDLLNGCRETCSRKCTVAKRNATNLIRYGGAPASNPEVQAKSKATTLKRFGVAHAAQSDIIKEKTKKTVKEKYGVDNYLETEECKEARKQAILRKYGTEYVSQSEKGREQIRQTNLERYGVECVLQEGAVRDQIRSRYKEKTGYSEPFANPEVRQKAEGTFLKKYGVRRPIQNSIIQDKLKSTNLERYGVENSMQSPDIRAKAAKTCLERYGVEHYSQSDEGKQRIHQIMIDRYGLGDVIFDADRIKANMKDPSKYDECVKFTENPRQYILDTFRDHKPSLKELREAVGLTDDGVARRVDRVDCRDLIDHVFSTMEREVYQALIDIDPDLKIERNTKAVIAPYELDIYLPDYQIGIECNPTSTHNSSRNLFDPTDKPLAYNYHQKKTKMCEDKGVFLFHIFGYDWTWKRDVIISMLRNMLGKNDTRIYARNTHIKEVLTSDSIVFLNENHRQGFAQASIRYGLYDENENLVSLMTFGKIRSTIGTGSEDTTGIYELVRFCNKMNTNVVGGASKLFKHFLREYNPSRVRSFSDRAHTRGRLYQTLGFHLVRNSDPGYVWVHEYTEKAYHRVNAQKKNIKKFLHDDTIDLSKTEKQIMEEHRFYQVFDSGTTLWEYQFVNLL